MGYFINRRDEWPLMSPPEPTPRVKVWWPYEVDRAIWEARIVGICLPVRVWLMAQDTDGIWRAVLVRLPPGGEIILRFHW